MQHYDNFFQAVLSVFNITGMVFTGLYPEIPLQELTERYRYNNPASLYTTNNRIGTVKSFLGVNYA